MSQCALNITLSPCQVRLISPSFSVGVILAIIIIYHNQVMLRLLHSSLLRFGSDSIRRQNFFELNPIYPDHGQKDFDIYNVEYKHIQAGQLAINDEQRYSRLKEKIKNDIYLKPVLDRNYDEKKGDYELDEETGFPLGLHEDFDSFIEIFKRQKKVGDDVVGEFENLTMALMRKFQAKTEIELIKIFRFNLATLQKDNLKDRLRGLLINNAFIRFIKERKSAGKSNTDLDFSEVQSFLNNAQNTLKKQSSEISKEELEEIAFRKVLQDFDNKIAKIEEEIHKKSLADRTFVPTYHPKYGQAVKETVTVNPNFDLNYGRGFPTKIQTSISGYTPLQAQDRYIQKRINELFFLRALNQVQKKQEIQVDTVIASYDLPLNIRNKDQIINSLLHKYKEYDLMIEPDLEDIYSEIDIALKKVAVKVVPNIVENQAENRLNGDSAEDSPSAVKERIVSKEVLIWSKLDVEEIFDPEYFEEQAVDSVKLNESELVQLSPSATMELSLNKMPMNLYRHADLDNFGIFNKYRKRVYKDYITDRTISPQMEFKFFSLEEAKNTLSKVKKVNNEVPDRYFGYGKRKSTEAEVYVSKGNGKVIINNQPLADYCGDVYHRGQVLKPLIYTETAGQWDLEFTVVGGGIHSQAECMSIALANALASVNPKFKKILEQTGLLGIDDRKNQAKKIGLYSARVRPPYVRR